jgi:hypothetical protein
MKKSQISEIQIHGVLKVNQAGIPAWFNAVQEMRRQPSTTQVTAWMAWKWLTPLVAEEP